MTHRFNGSGTVCLDGREISYTVVRSSRAKRLRLVIEGTPTVKVVVPERHRIGSVHDLLYPFRDWVFKHLDGLTAQREQAPANGTALPFLGGELQFFLEVSRTPTIRREGDNLVLAAPQHDGPFVLAAVASWYRNEARDVLKDRALHWSERMDVQPGRITVRDQKTRWGSCSSLGNLNFSWRLVMAPMPVLDYVVIHELAHLREPNHSPAFWSIVKRYSPDYIEHKRWLRDEGARLAEILCPQINS